jgi:5-bromo-4-chloroindolyl phosphate hydrolysis protein
MPLEPVHDDRRAGIKFDMTINLGHVLTFVGFIITIFAGWTSLDKRVLVLEESRSAQAQVDRHQDQLANQQLVYIRESLNEIKNSVNKLNERVNRQ